MEAVLVSYAKEVKGNEKRKHHESNYTTIEQTHSKRMRDARLAFVQALETLITLKYIAENVESGVDTNDKNKRDSSILYGHPAVEKDAISASWLLLKTSNLPSVKNQGNMSALQMSLGILSACQHSDEALINNSLFEILGAGEEETEFLFEIAPNVAEIRANITEDELRNAAKDTSMYDAMDRIDPHLEQIDPNDQYKIQLLQDYQEANDLATALQANLQYDSYSNNNGLGMAQTHTVKLESKKKLQKEAKKAAKVAATKLRLIKEAGMFIDGEMLMRDKALGGAQLELSLLEKEKRKGQTGGSGMKFMNTTEIQNMRHNLLPEGSKEYYENKGLPKGTERELYETYEKVIIPAAIKDPNKLHKRLLIQDAIPTQQMRKAFAGTTSLNPMQSAVFQMAFHSQENLLICAPTGAGKTNVAMLTVIAHFRDKGILKGGYNDDPYAAYNSISDNTSEFEAGKKVIYIAPMKALAQEVVEKFTSKLRGIKIITRELTGDMQLTKAEAKSADIIVTTPEKWDVVTRKGGDGSLSQSCGLLIIDEVHLLADERGAVIESVVARLHRLVESSQRQVRLVGLSATLPNYKDVAEFLRVDKNKGLFYFGPEHRPVPLQQTFIGIMEKNRSKKEKRMNEICYDTVTDSLQRGYQVMVFVHSRKGTSDTCEALLEIARAKEELGSLFVTKGTEKWGKVHTLYAERASKSRNRQLSNYFENGMGIHHAGMLRSDRRLTEQMFADGAIRVLCCTATLAWGINLPAHTVVIKGTDIYNAEKGTMVDLSILDVMQIFGRAGRPQFDKSGEATLITSHKALDRYLNLIVRSFPIESNFIKQLADHLNAEVCGGTVCNIDEATEWLTYTYLYVRMCRNPLAYGVTPEQKEEDPRLKIRTNELIKEAAKLLDKQRMVRYDEESGNLAVTDLGRIASHFYIQNDSIATFNGDLELKKIHTDADLIHLICCACEFENVRVRQEEMDDIVSVMEKDCPLKITAPLDEFSGKCCVLLQAFISNSRLSNFTLISDTNYIASNAGRVARALFEMCLKKGIASAAVILHRIAKSVDKRLWWFQSPLRQFYDEKIPENVFRVLESKRDRSRQDFYSLDDTLALLEMQTNELGQYIHWKKGGKVVQRCARMLPRIEMDCTVQPVTRGILRFQIQLTPKFIWESKYHGGAVGFWLWVEDGDNNRIYHHECILFTRRTHPEPLFKELTIPAFDPLPSQYFVRIVSDSWVGCETAYPVSFKHLLLPERSMPFTNLIDLTPLSKNALHQENFQNLYSKFETFNPIQTQLFHVLYHTDCPVLLGAPTGSGKTIVAELALLRLKRTQPNAKCVYIAPLKSLARERLKEWKIRFGSPPLNWKVLELSGDTNHDNRALNRADILVCTPEKWDLITRGWRTNSTDMTVMPSASRKFVKEVGLLIIDEIHLLGEERGAVLEAIVSRTRFISKQIRAEQHKSSIPKIKSKSNISSLDDIIEPERTRIIGLSTALANPDDLADWIGIDVKGHDMNRKRGLYNFRSTVRPVPMEVHIAGFPGRHYCPRMAVMNKPCYAAIKEHSPTKPAIIFVASRRQTRLTAMDLVSYAAGDGNPTAFLGCDETYIYSVAQTLSDEALRHTITFGIGLHHAGLSSHDRETVERLFLGGEIQVLVATATLAWGVNLPAHLVIVKGTEYFDGKSSSYVDYPVTDVLQMMGRAGRPQFDTHGVACVMVAEGKKNFYKHFLYKPFPVESCLKERICEILNAEIAIGTINSSSDALGYLDWTYFARRVKMNPSYYGAKSGSNKDVQFFFSGLIKDSLDLLRFNNCILTEQISGLEDDLLITPTILCKAACNFYLNYQTPLQMQIGIRRLHENIIEKVKANDSGSSKTGLPPDIERLFIAHLMFILSHVHEFDEIPVRHNEEQLNQSLSRVLPWRPDFLDNGKNNKYDDEMDMFSDPHIKTFLLLQAHITRTKLPISDYINDTKMIIDQIPRLLGAMQFVSVNGSFGIGSFEAFSLFYRFRQILNSKVMTGESPLNQIPGMSMDGVNRIQYSAGVKTLHELRSSPRANTFQILREALVGTKKRGKKISIENALDFIYSIYLIQIENIAITNQVEKSSGKFVGNISFNLLLEKSANDVKRKGKNTALKGTNTSLIIALGTPNERKLLGFKTIGVKDATGSVRRKITITFDWKLANAEADNKIILRVMHENIVGMDYQKAVQISQN